MTKESDLEDARARIRTATEGLDPATRLYAAISAFIGEGNRGEIVVTNPITGDVTHHITPARERRARDAVALARRRFTTPQDEGASLADNDLTDRSSEGRGR